MQLTLLKSKLHRACVTDAERDYPGSIVIDADFMKEVGILPFEQVDVYNITNGERFTTYAIEGEGGSKVIGIRGAAEHKAKKGDTIIICAYAQMSPDEAEAFTPKRIIFDENNDVVRK